MKESYREPKNHKTGGVRVWQMFWVSDQSLNILYSIWIQKRFSVPNKNMELRGECTLTWKSTKPIFNIFALDNGDT